VAIFLDDSHVIVVEKCSQVGLTVIAIIRMMDWLRQGLPGIYTLPTKVMMEQFVKNRLDPILTEVPYYKQHYATKKEDAAGSQLKTLFRRRVKFAGSNVRNHFFEFPAGWAIVDEHDECDTNNLRLLDTRLGRAKNKLKMILGNPTFDKRGIDELFKASDMKEWTVTCKKCNTEQVLTFFENCVRQVGPQKYVLRDRQVQAAINKARKTERLDIAIEIVRDQYHKRQQDARVYCKNPECQKPIDRHSIGKWKAKHPSRPVSGYHISKIFADPYPPAIISLFLEFTRALHVPLAMQQFMNTALGLPYEESGNRISEAMLAACAADYMVPFKLPMQVFQHDVGWTVAGVDVGTELHVHISAMWLKDYEIHRCKLWVGTLGGGLDDVAFAELHDLCVRFNVISGVIDALPEKRMARKFVKQHPNWWMAYYNKTDSKKDHTKDVKTRALNLDRTEALDMSLAGYDAGHVILPMNFRSIDNGEFLEQMKMPVRHIDEKSERPVWTKGKDHHRHADTYELFAARLARTWGGMKAA